METRPINAICLGGPCHGTLTYIDQDIDQDIGTIDVPLPPPGDETTDHHITREHIHHPSCQSPLTVLHWNHPIPSYGCATPTSCPYH